jgi:hypothetical protein
MALTDVVNDMWFDFQKHQAGVTINNFKVQVEWPKKFRQIDYGINHVPRMYNITEYYPSTLHEAHALMEEAKANGHSLAGASTNPALMALVWLKDKWRHVLGLSDRWTSLYPDGSAVFILRHESILDESVVIGAGTVICGSHTIGKNVRIGKNCRIGSRVRLESGVRIGNHVHIGDGCIIRNGEAPDAWTYPSVYMGDALGITRLAGKHRVHLESPYALRVGCKTFGLNYALHAMLREGRKNKIKRKLFFEIWDCMILCERYMLKFAARDPDYSLFVSRVEKHERWGKLIKFLYW